MIRDRIGVRTLLTSTRHLTIEEKIARSLRSAVGRAVQGSRSPPQKPFLRLLKSLGKSLPVNTIELLIDAAPHPSRGWPVIVPSASGENLTLGARV
jgi:hypothetical protein